MVLRVKLEIVPHGDESRIYEIGRLDIFNKGPLDDGDLYEYGVIDLGKEPGLYIRTVSHQRGHGAWFLLWIIIGQLGVKGP